MDKDYIHHPIFKMLKPHIVENFFKYHAENPHVFILFAKFSEQLRKSGRKDYGAKAIIERIRWHVTVETTGGEFKMVNNHTSCYARLLLIKDPSFDGFFTLRGSSGRVPIQESIRYFTATQDSFELGL